MFLYFPNFLEAVFAISISGKKGIERHLAKISKIVSANGFEINESKTRVMDEASGKKVTGLSVTSTVKVPLQFKRKLRQEINFCNKYGVSFHLRNSKNLENKCINFMGYLYGKAYFVGMIEPDVGERFLKQLDHIFDCEGDVTTL